LRRPWLHYSECESPLSAVDDVPWQLGDAFDPDMRDLDYEPQTNLKPLLVSVELRPRNLRCIWGYGGPLTYPSTKTRLGLVTESCQSLFRL
jgi:hypothetical protein